MRQPVGSFSDGLAGALTLATFERAAAGRAQVGLLMRIVVTDLPRYDVPGAVNSTTDA